MKSLSYKKFGPKKAQRSYEMIGPFKTSLSYKMDAS